MKTKTLAVTFLFALSAFASPIFAQQGDSTKKEPEAATTPADAPYKNSKLPTEQRVKDLVSRMTLEEKAAQVGHTAPAIPRLGVPEYNWWNEGLHGVARAGIATVFPQAIGLAATFDEPLMHEVADVISTEFRAKYSATVKPDGSTDWYRGLTVWSPNINIFRDPRWGRGQETYGEDPFLTARLGVAFVTGLQGNDPKYLKTVATPKHFAVHSGPESTRHTVDVTASRHDMEDTYFPAFRATVIHGKAESVMCAYNSLNGQPACANTFLLEEHLRHDWGFKGYVVSDCGAIADVFNVNGHHFAPDAGRRRRRLVQSRHGRDLRRLPAPNGDRTLRDRECREPRSAPRGRSRSGALSPLQRAIPSRNVRSEIRRSVFQDHACGKRH